MAFEIIVMFLIFIIFAFIITALILYGTGMLRFVGATGATGATGQHGSASATGATGPIGPFGPTGPIGLIGNRGVTGPTGQKGADGTSESLITLYPGGMYQNNTFQSFGSQIQSEQFAQIVINKAGIVHNMIVRNQPTANNGRIIRSYFLKKNGATTDLFIQMIVTDIIVSNTTASISVIPGDLLSVYYTESVLSGTILPTTGAITFSIS